MSDILQQYCATDKEIHDLLISGKQKITDGVLHELARDRGIFFSPKTTREDLVVQIALLPHDYHDIVGIIDHRDHNKRAEKTTSVELSTSMEVDDIKSIVEEYRDGVTGNEKVTYFKKGADGFVMHISYDEYDYSKTTLIQRQRRDAEIEFVTKDGIVTIRNPATEKAKTIVEDLRGRIAQKKLTEVPAQRIELIGLPESETRTSFFTSLISKIPDYVLQTVINLKVASGKSDEKSDSVDLDEEETDTAKQEMLAVVHSAALNGTNLVASKQYQELRAGGFYITSITWRSKQKTEPFSLVQFDASFENPIDGTGFKYGVRIAARQKNGEYAKNFKPVADDKVRAQLFELIENTSRSVLAELCVKKYRVEGEIE
jgi:tetrahydromethanopterin S-methyltransferase subunit F